MMSFVITNYNKEEIKISSRYDDKLEIMRIDVKLKDVIVEKNVAKEGKNDK